MTKEWDNLVDSELGIELITRLYKSGAKARIINSQRQKIDTCHAWSVEKTSLENNWKVYLVIMTESSYQNKQLTVNNINNETYFFEIIHHHKIEIACIIDKIIYDQKICEHPYFGIALDNNFIVKASTKEYSRFVKDTKQDMSLKRL